MAAGAGRVEGIGGVTLRTRDMARSVAFYEALGFVNLSAEPARPATTFAELVAGSGYLHLLLETNARARIWGQIVFWVDDADALHEQARRAGLAIQTSPAYGTWGERYFVVQDPDGHTVRFARPVR